MDVKKGKDKIREPQLLFMHLAKEILDVPSKIIYLSENTDIYESQMMTFEVPSYS